MSMFGVNVLVDIAAVASENSFENRCCNAVHVDWGFVDVVVGAMALVDEPHHSPRELTKPSYQSTPLTKRLTKRTQQDERAFLVYLHVRSSVLDVQLRPMRLSTMCSPRGVQSRV